jgi:hypothetical protein
VLLEFFSNLRVKVITFKKCLLREQGSRVGGVRGEVLRALSKCVRFNTLLSRSPRVDIVKLRKELALANLLACELLSCYKVLKVTVIYKYSN